LLEFVLGNAGYQVVTAENGLQALQRLAEETPSLVLCDILMPGVDGFDVLTAVRSNPDTNALPVLMLSALGQEKDLQRAMEAGANSYIVKPFSLRQLLREVNRFLELLPR
jgi:CheY-like chemotaxis protein